MATFKHGDHVTLFDAYGGYKEGQLHSPDVECSVFDHSNPPRAHLEMRPQSTSGAYAVHTLILPDGRKFRTEGRLTKAVA